MKTETTYSQINQYVNQDSLALLIRQITPSVIYKQIENKNNMMVSNKKYRHNVYLQIYTFLTLEKKIGLVFF